MNLFLIKGAETNLYTSSGIAAGTQIRIQVQSEQMVTLSDTSAGLARDPNGDCVTLGFKDMWTNKAGAAGAWAKAETGGCLINVSEA